MNTLSHWIEICCGSTLFLLLPFLLSKGKIYLVQKVQKKIFQVFKPQRWVGVKWANGAPQSQHGKCCKGVGCLCTGGRTLSIDANPVAPHSMQFEERLWLLSEGCNTPTTWIAHSICCYCVCACEKVGFPPHSICLQAQAQLQGIQFFI